MKKSMVFTGVLLAMGLCAAPLWAQLDGSTRGTVVDQSGKPIAGAVVQLYDSTSGRKYQAKTNDKGEYVVGVVYEGTYKYTLFQNGNPIDEKNNVPISTGQEQVVNFDLAKDLGSAPAPNSQAAEAAKSNEKIKGLNNVLKQAKDLEGAGNYDQAVTLLQQTAQANPNQDLIWAYLGDAQRGAAGKQTDAQARSKEYQDAVDSYQKAIALKPNNGPYMAQMADAYAKLGQTDKAVEQYNAAAQADPPNAAKYYYNEGVAFTNTGKSDEAIAALDKSIQLDPKRADAYYLKGQNLLGKATTDKSGKMTAPEGTADAFNKYLELDPNGKFADVAKQMLASIGASVQTSYGKSKPSKKQPNQ